MPPLDSAGFRFVGERTKVDGHFIRLVAATFVDPNGFTFERQIVRHPGAVCVVPIEDDGTVLLVRQYRGAIDEMMLEFPAGKRDIPNEDPEICARRELAEEVGREATSIIELGRFVNSPGFTDEETICYLAEGLRPVAITADGIEEEHMTIERLPFTSLWKLVESGEITDAKTIIALTYAERLIASRNATGS